MATAASVASIKCHERTQETYNCFLIPGGGVVDRSGMDGRSGFMSRTVKLNPYWKSGLGIVRESFCPVANEDAGVRFITRTWSNQ